MRSRETSVLQDPKLLMIASPLVCLSLASRWESAHRLRNPKKNYIVSKQVISYGRFLRLEEVVLRDLDLVIHWYFRNRVFFVRRRLLFTFILWEVLQLKTFSCWIKCETWIIKIALNHSAVKYLRKTDMNIVQFTVFVLILRCN